MKRVLLVLAMGAVEAVLAGPPAAPGLVLADTAVVRGEHVRLDEVVAGAPVPLAPLFLGEAPAAGSERTITRGEILLRLSQAGIPDLALEGESVRVTRGEALPGVTAGEVCVAARRLPAGTVVTAADVTSRQPFPGERTTGFLAGGAVAGMELAREIPAGAPFASDSVREPVCIRKGDVVRLVSGSRGVSISFHARAEGDARRGEVVRVRPLRDPQTLVEAVAVRPGEARMRGTHGEHGEGEGT